MLIMLFSRNLIGALILALSAIAHTTYSPRITCIIGHASKDGIDLPVFPFANAAFAEIEAIAFHQQNFHFQPMQS